MEIGKVAAHVTLRKLIQNTRLLLDSGPEREVRRTGTSPRRTLTAEDSEPSASNARSRAVAALCLTTTMIIRFQPESRPNTEEDSMKHHIIKPQERTGVGAIR